MKKQIFLFILMMLPMVASADAVEIEGIYYNLDETNHIAEVTKNPNKYTGNIVIPSNIEFDGLNFQVTKISGDNYYSGGGAFGECDKMTSIIIPNTVTDIGIFAFYKCTGLTSVIIPNSVVNMDAAFSGCTGLISVEIGNSVKYMNEAFEDCTGLVTVEIPNSVSQMGAAFRRCSNLLYLNLPNTIKNISWAFEGCSSLMSINIPTAVTDIGYRTFSGCSNLTTITIPDGVTNIGSYAFSGCTGLTSISLPKSILSIEGGSSYNSGAFYNCYNLQSVNIIDIGAWCNITFGNPESNPLYYAHLLYVNGEEKKDIIIPNSVDKIGDYAFIGCNSINRVSIPSTVTSVGKKAFAYSSELTEVSIQSPLTLIDEYAFISCYNLLSIELPDNLRFIRSGAFSGCDKLYSITIPASVEYIYQNAFDGCSALEVINAQPTTPPFLYNNSFSDFTVPVNVPSGCAEAYRTAQGWSNFTTINDGNVYYQLSVTADNHGTVTYNNTAVKNTTKTFDVMEATSATLTLTPDEGYKLNTVTVNGTDKTADVVNGTLTISNVTANTTVSVTFGIAGETETVTIGAAGMATFCSSKDLDFSKVEGLKAYTGAAFNRNTGALTMLEVKDVPAGTGLIVVGNAGSYDVPVSSGSSCVYANLLKGVSTATNLQQTANGYTNYILGSGAQGTGFYIVSAGGGTLAASKAYLQIPTAAANSRSAISMEFVEGTTGVGEATLLMDNGKLTMDNVVFDLQGRRVTKPQKPGIYVKNGRKVVVK